MTASPRAKKAAYAISDHFLRFHFRFVDPAKSQLRTNALAASYVHDTVIPELDHHASHAWEDISREYVSRNTPGVTTVGRWWGPVPTAGRRSEVRELDVVGVDSNRTPVALGMCEWTSRSIDFDELNLLDRLAEHVDGHTGEEHRYLFARNGFTERLRTFAAGDRRLHLVSPEDIYGRG